MFLEFHYNELSFEKINENVHSYKEIKKKKICTAFKVNKNAFSIVYRV